MKKYVYLFKEADGKNKALFGGKGANLAEMTKIGLPVPQGFTITTEACTKYYEDGRMINDSIKAQIEEKLAQIEKMTGKKFGDATNPLLVSVRSGARVSMPGMMDTILNLGLNDEVVEGLAKLTNNEKSVLVAIVANAKQVGDNGVEFILEDVAKEMGMSTSEMVTAVQDGTIKTEDFFNAIQKVDLTLS